MCIYLYQIWGGHSSQNHIRVNGTFTTGHTNKSGQHNLRWHNELKNATKNLQGNGHSYLLA